jgi:hypothetical protein
MDTFQSPRSMANAVLADAMKEQRAVTAATTATAAAATASLFPTTTTNNSSNLNSTDKNIASNIATDQTSNGTISIATIDSSLTTDAEDASTYLLPSTKRTKSSNSSSNNNSNSMTNIDEVDSFWNSAETEAELEIAFKKTMDLANKQTERVIREGYVVCVSLESLAMNPIHRFSHSLISCLFSDLTRFIA